MVLLKVIPTNKDEVITTAKSLLTIILNYFPRYTLKSIDTLPINVDERLPWLPTILLSFQHVLAMFGATVGYPTNTALLFSGVGTIIFYICTGGKVPSYLGSSFAFVGVVNAATGYVPGSGPNPNIPLASGGIVICGFIYLGISLIVLIAGHAWLEFLTPPVVTGSVIISIGLHLANNAVNQANTSGFDAWMALVTVFVVVLCTCYGPGPLKRLPILVGGVTGYLVYLFFGLGGVGPGIDFTIVKDSKWIGAPATATPKFDGTYVSLIAPAAIILAAENIGHLKAVATMSNRNMDKLLGRTFLGDSIATIIAGACGSIGTTTYAENIGVMSITKIFSTVSFLVAAVIAIILGFLPIFGAVVQTIPQGVFGGLSIILFGITAMTGCKLFIEANVDFSKPRNLLTAGISIVLGVGMINVVVEWGTLKIDGIGVATFSAIFLYQLLNENWGTIFRKALTKITGRNFMKTHKGQYDEQQNDLTDSQIRNDSAVIDMNKFDNNNNNSISNNDNEVTKGFNDNAVVVLDK
ncbi:hypothetical protein DICPUDRAFT_155904 [Dictyostelium purpureum]|uniref:Xanthine/uracil/vitamin C permease n=1 Tax=Dictyostelium purpureum TaxID=5786 RepID=F0ZV66_DICPU|nr:uncharacterized protein DICPUDRAFT_155904 [Dictyostelium purpureum]EGC32173.1 hypothetical protein DICPUDRAFT_155904 [Dictyostelium purpureum]|eukprot:XP_003291311.1 hypothetical protein DICPUDRAFT_155904 [Dictyostelium purpureum]